MTSKPRFALVCLDTWQIETFAGPVRLVNINDLAGDEYVPDGDDYTDDSRVIDLATDHGVPVAELWAAYKREQQRESVS
jgi:hypothetical protein